MLRAAALRAVAARRTATTVTTTTTTTTTMIIRGGRCPPLLGRSIAPTTELLLPPRRRDDVRRSLSSSTARRRRRGAPTVEERYSRKTPLEHVLLRPGMYVGSTERSAPRSEWVLRPRRRRRRRENDDDERTTTTTRTTSAVPFGGASTTIDVDDVVATLEEVRVVPALQKVFDEILVNASDNHRRCPDTCTRIDVVIDPGGDAATADAESGERRRRKPFFSVTNNGECVPVQLHKEENMYVPEMVFGHLLTGSNFRDDDEDDRGDDGASSSSAALGGRHGYGAKLTNIFSEMFQVETVDTARGLRYEQTWTDNMTRASPPIITPLKEEDGVDYAEDYTRVSFVPDLGRLVTGGEIEEEENGDRYDNTCVSADDYELLCKRVWDVAGCSRNLTVTLNGTTLPLNGDFHQYAKLYCDHHHHRDDDEDDNDYSSSSSALCFHRLRSPRGWEVGVTLSPDATFRSVSFVNGVVTPRGGTHVEAVARQVSKYLADKLSKRLSVDVKPASVRRRLLVLVNATVDRPSFDSQSKDRLTSRGVPTDPLPERFLRTVLAESGVAAEVEAAVRGRESADRSAALAAAAKRRRRGGGGDDLSDVPKLDDARAAGTRPRECTLLLTEGDSAKALAVAGLEVVGRDGFGVFPLRGKLLNVREASPEKLAANVELGRLCRVVGLDPEKTYATTEERDTLRYGSVTLMTDQDADGSHIKGLVMNLFRHFWPALLRPAVDANDDDDDHRPFLSYFVTPLLKATPKKSKKKKKDVLSFYSAAEFERWRDSLADDDDDDDVRDYAIKYYKGLGTSTPAEAKEYFAEFDFHHRPYHWTSEEEDGERLDMAFDKDRAEDRKRWIAETNERDDDDADSSSSSDGMTYREFVDRELLVFSNADNVRSLPSVVDGLKPSQRKVLYACFKRNLRRETKVAQLAGYCAEHTAYHHGEASLHATIIGMAQDFVGSNNVNLLEPSGQFGTRLEGGKDAASPRYVFTRLSPVARRLFPEADDEVLTYREDDGQRVEPDHYCPVLPLLLVNGAQGIGTGWSTSVPPHDPKDLMAYARHKLDGGDASSAPPIRPWVRGFRGEIVSKPDGDGYVSRGRVRRVSRTRILIDELPVGRWTNDYRTFLSALRDRGDVRSFAENHTTDSVSFTVGLKSVVLDRLLKNDDDDDGRGGGGALVRKLRLESVLPRTNMHAFDADGSIRRYDRPEDVADAHFEERLRLYRLRRERAERTLARRASSASNKARFVREMSDGTIDVARRPKRDAEASLRERGYAETRRDADNDEEEEEEEEKESGGYDYLLNMPLSSLTAEQTARLTAEAKRAEEDLKIMRATTPEDLWRADLDKLEPYL